jgi:hypothetical protein
MMATLGIMIIGMKNKKHISSSDISIKKDDNINVLIDIFSKDIRKKPFKQACMVDIMI